MPRLSLSLATAATALLLSLSVAACTGQTDTLTGPIDLDAQTTSADASTPATLEATLNTTAAYCGPQGRMLSFRLLKPEPRTGAFPLWVPVRPTVRLLDGRRVEQGYTSPGFELENLSPTVVTLGRDGQYGFFAKKLRSGTATVRIHYPTKASSCKVQSVRFRV
jgi:hypothetical protein